ncbi:glycosyl hydrolase family 28-related protein [Hymenobacter sp. BRD67]|uniref:glycosyl hydrolase family 28-related protein n=1 Tax=Hymenobacter sp. BRD67 TaxID=2675877 RepID=UPI001C26EBC8|nr:glycosyl hydrolase family 28-related protein [Hymenobacter sp. BRD67]
MKLFSLLWLAALPALAQTPAHDVAWYTQHAPFTMPAVPDPVIPAHTVSIKEFGGVADGKTLNTEAFAKAIAACAQAGGGHVVVPAGTWLTGPIELRSNIDLHTEAGTMVLFTPDRTHYPLQAAGRGQYEVTPPIWGTRLENVAITGPGVFDGSGEAWRPLKKGKVSAGEWDRVVRSGACSAPMAKSGGPAARPWAARHCSKSSKTSPMPPKPTTCRPATFCGPKWWLLPIPKTCCSTGRRFATRPCS